MLKFLTVLWVLLAPLPAWSQAMFAPFMAASSASNSVTGAIPSAPAAFYGQIKPTGPIELNRQSPFAPLVSMYDRGDGVYINGAYGNAADNGPTFATYSGGASTSAGFIQGVNSTPRGTAGLWPGASITNGFSGNGLGAWIVTGVDTGGGVQTGLDINAASNLTALAAGAGYSVAVQVYRVPGTISADFEWYGGRTWISNGEGWEQANSCAAPGVMWGFVENAGCGASGNYVVGAYVVTGTVASPTQKTLGSFTIAPNAYYELGIDCVNTSSGSASCEWLINSAVQSCSSCTGLSLPSTTNTGETWIEAGATRHASGLSNHTCYCYVYKIDFYSRKLSLSEWSFRWNNPWSMYKPK
jgi:hypothetical protein